MGTRQDIGTMIDGMCITGSIDDYEVEVRKPDAVTNGGTISSENYVQGELPFYDDMAELNALDATIDKKMDEIHKAIASTEYEMRLYDYRHLTSYQAFLERYLADISIREVIDFKATKVYSEEEADKFMDTITRNGYNRMRSRSCMIYLMRKDTSKLYQGYIADTDILGVCILMRNEKNPTALVIRVIPFRDTEEEVLELHKKLHLGIRSLTGKDSKGRLVTTVLSFIYE